MFQVTIRMELWDSAAAGGAGKKLGETSIALDLSEFEPFKAQSATVELQDKDKKVQPFEPGAAIVGSCVQICGLWLQRLMCGIWILSFHNGSKLGNKQQHGAQNL